MDEHERGYFESYLKWESKMRPRYVASEMRFYDKERRITGQVDAIAAVTPDFTCVVDFKTTAQPHPKVWGLQGTLYKELAEINGWEVNNFAIFVQLDKNGGDARVHSFDTSEPKYKKAISHLVSLRDYLK